MTAEECVALLFRLIAIPAFSGEEKGRADLIADLLKENGFNVQRAGNNVWAYAHANVGRPVLLLNSHLDTVKPATGYSRDPFLPAIENGKLYGLGANDAGASLVTLLYTFISHAEQALPYQLCFLASAEEENSGSGGMVLALAHVKNIYCAIVGEPTGMQPCVAQKGLMVLDIVTRGKSGHAARDTGDNAIYKAIGEIRCIEQLVLPKVSEHLGKIRFSVTQVNAGKQHNVIPDECRWVIDVRSTDQYTHEEILNELRKVIQSEISPRSVRLQPSFIPNEHPLVKAAIKTGGIPFGSPTLSDTALMPFPALKIGPGKSERSHTADEYILVDEIEKALIIYSELLKNLI
ncbi:MAG: M20/M25/M40 family metallo-hydrolase [Bacteroidia bacterium]|nr:M20/M25/M40 family metallo-hydrolase [Bacteroidia bacterium]